MKVHFAESFLKDLKAVEDNALRQRIGEVIRQVEQAPTVQDIRNLKSGDQYYRIRVGNYRLGLTLQKDTIVMKRCLHRKDIYRYFK